MTVLMEKTELVEAIFDQLPSWQRSFPSNQSINDLHSGLWNEGKIDKNTPGKSPLGQVLHWLANQIADYRRLDSKVTVNPAEIDKTSIYSWFPAFELSVSKEKDSSTSNCITIKGNAKFTQNNSLYFVVNPPKNANLKGVLNFPAWSTLDKSAHINELEPLLESLDNAICLLS